MSEEVKTAAKARPASKPKAAAKQVEAAPSPPKRRGRPPKPKPEIPPEQKRKPGRPRKIRTPEEEANPIAPSRMDKRLIQGNFGAATQVGIDNLCVKLNITRQAVLAMSINSFLANLGLTPLMPEEIDRNFRRGEKGERTKADGTPVKTVEELRTRKEGAKVAPSRMGRPALAGWMPVDKVQELKLLCGQLGVSQQTAIGRGLKLLFEENGIDAPVDHEIRKRGRTTA